MKYLLLICFSFFIEQCNQSYYSASEKGAIAGKAFISCDYEAIAECTYPKWIEHNGGRSKFIDELKQEFDYLQRTNSFIKGFAFDNIIAEPIRDGSILLYVLPLKLETVTAGLTLNEEMYFITISTDDGKNWSIIHTRKLNEKKDKIRSILTMFPALDGKIEWISYKTF